MITIKLALRDWDYLTPLLLGDIKPSGFRLHIERVGTLPDDLAVSNDFDGAEVSFSRYVQSVANQENGIVALPHFLMRGFRHRCIITRKNNLITHLSHLKNKRIGVTGWQDSGNVWTRAALRNAGVDINDALWYAGRLTSQHPITDRLGKFRQPGRIDAMPEETPLMDALNSGFLDAVCTPFMPAGFFDKNSPFRQVSKNFYAEETEYYQHTDYVPGIHVLGFKKSFADNYPELTKAVSDLIDESKKMWKKKREKYADTSPWLLDELNKSTQSLSPGWDNSGLKTNEKMISDFVQELFCQKIIQTKLTPEALFPTTTL